jgi:hypothetical protein
LKVNGSRMLECELLASLERLTKPLLALDIRKFEEDGYNSLRKFAIRKPAILASLQKLSLGNAYRLDDCAMVFFLKATPLLVALNLRDCASLTDEFFCEIGPCCPLLEDLNLSNTKITDTGLESILNHCTKLKQLALIKCSRISDKGLSAISIKARNLVLLSLFKSFGDTASAVLISIAENFLHLQSVSFPGIPEGETEVVATFVRCCPRLQNICTTFLFLKRCQRLYPWLEFEDRNTY